jgi:N-acetylglutamate synthase-like GNAT family acetyltransferase
MNKSIWEIAAGDSTISDDRSRLDMPFILSFLSQSYWAVALTEKEVLSSIENSLVVGLYDVRDNQIGFARIVTDKTRFAWVSDFFVSTEQQRLGLGLTLLESVLGHPDLVTVSRWMLATKDMFNFYSKAGFVRVTDTANLMILER